ncbi:MAG: RluA family pseudouridine synthase [Lachnospiraceae bacterium]|nr:RluA family pseudouridine synthase [Lachnospiraceae bacterium]
MKMLRVAKEDEGQRLDKYLKKHLKYAASGFIYKMLRKKNITLNSKKASGSEIIKEADEISFFFSDETYKKFTNDLKDREVSGSGNEGSKHLKPGEICYEDENTLVVNKPCGMLSQRDKSGDISMNDLCLRHYYGTLRENTGYSSDFVPSICNRLDRNTSGLIIFAKNYRAFRMITDSIKKGEIGKYYFCLVKGKTEEGGMIKTWYKKDGNQNKAVILTEPEEGVKYAETRYKRMAYNGELSLLRVKLITGRSHQIRAHMAHIGHPVLGDTKYGDKTLNKKYRESHGVTCQLLHAGELVFPGYPEPLKDISDKKIVCELPEIYKEILNGDMEFQRSSGFHP